MPPRANACKSPKGSYYMNRTKISCAIVTALAFNPAIAQEKTAKAQIETIQITATKRTESIQDVPISVSALNGEMLENLGIESFSDYVEFLPNVVFKALALVKMKYISGVQQPLRAT